MKFFENLFVSKNEGPKPESGYETENPGGRHIAIPTEGGDPLSAEESEIVNTKKEIQRIKDLIALIESNPNHPDFDTLPSLREKLDNLMEGVGKSY